MISLIGCSLTAPKYQQYTLDCVWYKEVHFSPETKRRLKAGGPSASVRRDVEAILANNLKFQEICN